MRLRLELDAGQGTLDMMLAVFSVSREMWRRTTPPTGMPSPGRTWEGRQSRGRGAPKTAAGRGRRKTATDRNPKTLIRAGHAGGAR